MSAAATGLPHDALTGIRVVNFALHLPGPLTAQHLRELGAEVIKVEPPHGDPFAAIAPGWYQAMSAGHDIRRIDLKSDSGRADVEKLLEEADVVITSFRPAALTRMGLDRLSTRYPRLIHIDIVGDTDHPDAPGHDLTYQAAAGTLTAPTMPAVLLGDVLGAHRATELALAGLLRRVGSGDGGHFQVGLKQAAVAAAAGRDHGLTAPEGILGGAHWTYGIYECADGYIAVAALEPHFESALTEITGATTSAQLGEFLKLHPTAYLAELAAKHQLPLAPVR